jgi:ribulose-phosphate 3-epimerase
MKILITPSILSANLTRLQEEVDSVATADWLQVDVMDGHFVPNVTFGTPILKDLKTNLPLDIHLMVSNPADRVDEFVKVGAHNITFHAEAVPNPPEQRALITSIKTKGCTAGIAINPDTPLDAVETILSSASSASPASSASSPDLLLCMTVPPGFAGQAFREDVLGKIREARQRMPKLMIQVDGGIDARTAKLCKEAGATNLVAASFIFDSKDRKKAIQTLRKA